MGFWFKSKKPALPVVQEEARPRFSTHNTVLDLTAYHQKVQAALGKSVQIKLSSYAAVDSAGESAMDQSLVEAKLLNTSNGFLPLNQVEWYSAQGFIGWQQCAILAQHWLIDKCCTMPAKDAIRHGWDNAVNDGTEVKPEVFDEMRRWDKKFQLKKNLLEYVKFGRTFGLRHILFLIDSPDAEYYEKPFNPDGVTRGSYKGMTQIDPYWLAPELDRSAAADPAAQDFYEPTWWRVNGKRVHRTHFVIFRNGDEVADILKPSYFYGGIPTPQKICERVYAAERTANEAPLLAMTKRLIALKIDTTKGIANPAELQQEMEFWSKMMNNFGVKLIGQEEEVQQLDTSLTGLDETIMTQFQLVAAASGIPATKLLGTSPKGFNASGEYEEASYHEELESLQENDLSPVVERHNMLVIRSYISPKFGMKPFNTETVWNPCDTPTAAEQADINLKKAQTDAALINAGSIDGFDSRQRLIQDKDSGYNGIPDVVPGGPGDREAEQAAAETSAEDRCMFDPALGTLDGARLITHQKFLDEGTVLQKMAAEDYVVNVTPEFEDDGKKYRVVLDGHHSLAAAMRARVSPTFVTEVPRDVVFNAATRQATDEKKA